MDEHIKIGDVAPRVQYVADGVRTSFTYPFPIFVEGDIAVWLDGVPQAGGFGVTGAGTSEGGSVVFARAPARGCRVMLRRGLTVARTTDFQSNGVLRARTLNDELDYQVAALQDVKDGLGSTLRLDPSEAGADTVLPLREGRANRLLGFDSIGNITTFGRDEGLLTLDFPGAIPRTVEDKLAERLTARDFGATGDGTTDDGPSLQAAMNAAAASGRLLEIGEGTFRTTAPLYLAGAAAGLAMRGTILYDGPGGAAALTLGDGGGARNQRKRYTGLGVLRAAQSDWLSEEDVGIRLRNLDACLVDIRRAERFTIGVQLIGDGRGSEDSDLYYGRIIDNRIGLDLRTLTASAWMNALRHHGGQFACQSATNPDKGRFGVRFSAAPGAYPRHNAHLFTGPSFELQRQGTPGTVDAIPFLLEAGDERGIVARGVRMEACSPYVARHAGGAQDCIYEVSYVGTYAFTGCAVDYAATATRAGGIVVPYHQAAVAQHTPRLIADASDVRRRAFRERANAVGFEGMALLSSWVDGLPTSMNALLFPGLEDIGLGSDSVTLPTSRALGFVVDCSACKEFMVAAEGSGIRIVVQLYDAGETLLPPAAHPVLLSNGGMQVGSADTRWWEGGADLDSLIGGMPLNTLQRVTLPAAASKAFIGVRGGSGTATLRALRLYTAGHHYPQVLTRARAAGINGWGLREMTATAPYDPPGLASGNTTVAISSGRTAALVPLPGVAQGDFIQVGWVPGSGFQNGGILFHGSVGATAELGGSGTAQLVTVTVQNLSGGTNDLPAGTLHVRAVKPRL